MPGKRLERDIAGIRSGKVVAIAPTNEQRRNVYLWKCHCDCGKNFLVEPYKILSGRIQSCGCGRKSHNTKDLTNQQFGKLTAIQRLDEKIGSNYAWLCKCECGKMVKVSTHNLLATPGTRSCGCGRIDAVMNTIAKHGAITDHCTFLDGTCVERLEHKQLQRNNTSGYVGVQIRGNRYIATIGFKGKSYYLGSFCNIDEAIQARQNAEKTMHGAFLEWYYQVFRKHEANNQQKSNSSSIQ